MTCKTCSDPFQHNHASALNVHKRNKIKSLLLSMIRHPEDRAMSHHAMNYKLKNKVGTPSATKILHSLKNERNMCLPNVQLMFLFPFMNLYESHNNHSDDDYFTCVNANIK